jgi:protein SCO1/2
MLRLTAILLLLVYPLAAETSREPEGVGVDQKLGEMLPLDLMFKNEEGKLVPLRSFFKKGRPVLIAPSYFECVRLCTYLYNGIGKAIKATPSLLPGRDYTIISLSINPEDTPVMAKMKGENYREALLEAGGPDLQSEAWSFVTGSEENIRAVTEAIGFRYKKDGRDFSHPAAIVIVTPEGKVSRYLFGIEFEPRDYRLALIDASDGEIGSIVDAAVLSCFRYDPVEGKYTPFAWGFMRIGGLATLGLLLAIFLVLKRREKNT